MNTNYPSIGKWFFVLNSIVAEENNVVTDVSITNGTLKARAITFHTVENNLIVKQRESIGQMITRLQSGEVSG